MKPLYKPQILIPVLMALASSIANAETIGCVTTAWKLIGANHKVCVEAFHDPKVPGVTCHVSQAKTGGVSGAVGLAQDPSILFKETRIVRMWDAANRTLVYLAISRKLIDGAPANSISTVPVMPWGGR